MGPGEVIGKRSLEGWLQGRSKVGTENGVEHVLAHGVGPDGIGHFRSQGKGRRGYAPVEGQMAQARPSMASNRTRR
jgi:hypothetical protein